jgi:hypothetical protein
MRASGYLGSFHVDRIIARQHGGEAGPENLALACLHCNQHKRPNIAGRDRLPAKSSSSFIRGETVGATILNGTVWT